MIAVAVGVGHARGMGRAGCVGAALALGVVGCSAERAETSSQGDRAVAVDAPSSKRIEFAGGAFATNNAALPPEIGQAIAGETTDKRVWALEVGERGLWGARSERPLPQGAIDGSLGLD